MRSFHETLDDLKIIYDMETALLQEEIVSLKDQLHQLRTEPPGHVVLTKRGDTEELVMVSRQDDDGHILSIIWEKPIVSLVETPTQMMDDVGSFATRHLPLD